MAKLEIKNPTLSPATIEVYLDGAPVNHLRRLELSMGCDEVAIAKIEFYLDEVYVDAEVLLELQARLDKQENEKKIVMVPDGEFCKHVEVGGNEPL